MQIRTFNPLKISRINRLCTTMALLLTILYIMAAIEILNNPDVHIKGNNRGGGGYFFWPVSYILTGTEDNHILLRDKVIQHVNTGNT